MDLYKVLGLKKEDNPSKEDIKKAYRAKAKIHHPDKGGDEEVFKNINKSYEILNDSQKRSKYDMFGATDNENESYSQFGNHGFPFGHDIFNMFSRQTNTNSNTAHQINIKLSDVFCDIIKKMKIESNNICSECKNNRHTCVQCNGEGVTHQMKRLGPGMFQKSSRECESCCRSGFITDKNCIHCKGTGKRKLNIILNVHIKKGVQQDELIHVKYIETGKTFTFKVNILKDEMFDIENRNLIFRHNLSISDSLCGFNHSIKLPDNTFITIRRNTVTKDQMIFKVTGYGLPVSKNNVAGDLFIIVNVIYPVFLDDLQTKSIKDAFKDSNCTYNAKGKNVIIEECLNEKENKTNNSSNCRTH
jgi:DnaJ-class molecular chaperone